jgi:phenylalanyl-tRNA synthetase beta chain
MIISLNWLKKFTDIDISIDELQTLIGARLVEIESIENTGEKYKDVVIARVIECGPLEGTDHLNLTKIDDGRVVSDIERDENGLVQVVCGAPNVRVGMLVAWLPPRSVVPDTYNDAEPFVLAAKKLRGAVSNGMLASAKELDLFDDHDGILEIDIEVDAGSSFAKAYELDDYIIDIENKSLTHRPDAFGIIGFAREVAAIQGKTFVTPEWLASVNPILAAKGKDNFEVTVAIDDASLSERYMAVVMSGADGSRHSPLLIQTYLSRVGVRPISAVVDVTNYLMMMTGQPLHAFDYDKLVSVGGGKADIHVRGGNPGEKLELLDGRVVELAIDDIVIAAGDTAIGLAGAMGGANTVIDDTTKTIIIESATFNLYKLRATQMRHGIFSEAITRFTKGQPAALSAPVLAQAIELMGQWSGAARVSDVAQATGEHGSPISIEVSAEKVNRLLGTNMSIDDIENTLESVEFSAVSNPGGLIVTAPYWRSDIHIIQDVIEEVGRLTGYDEITPTLPVRDFTPVAPSDFDTFRSQVRRLLARAGANEVLSYSFIHGDVLQKSGQVTDNSYRITNSISPDLQYYRQSLSPSIIGLVHPNIKAGFDDIALFELNKVHPKHLGLTGESVPVETDALAAVIAHKKLTSGASYFEAKSYVEYITGALGINVSFEEQVDPAPVASPFDPKRSAVIKSAGGTLIGIAGEYRRATTKAFKLPESCAGFELDMRQLFAAYTAVGNAYTVDSKYPSIARDVCFNVNASMAYAQIVDTIDSELSRVEWISSVSPVDIYQSDDVSTKNITVRISFTARDKTLSSDAVAGTIDAICKKVISVTNATIV